MYTIKKQIDKTYHWNNNTIMITDKKFDKQIIYHRMVFIQEINKQIKYQVNSKYTPQKPVNLLGEVGGHLTAIIENIYKLLICVNE